MAVGTGVLAGIWSIFAALRRLRAAAFRRVQKSLLVTRPRGPRTPFDVGVPYEPLWIDSGANRLAAWYARGRRLPNTGEELRMPLRGTLEDENTTLLPFSEQPPAVLVYHGRNESISDWVDVLQHLWRRGISVLLFDYSGFGDSTGSASVEALREDARSAYRAFVAQTPGMRRYLLGLSLGTGPMLEEAARLTSLAADGEGWGGEWDQPAGIVLIAGYSSARDAAVVAEAIPAALSLILPDLYNNVEAVARVHAPLLVVHSRDDQFLPVWMAERIYAAANEPKELVLLDGLRHRDLLEGDSKIERYLAPVVDFIARTATLAGK